MMVMMVMVMVIKSMKSFEKLKFFVVFAAQDSRDFLTVFSFLLF